MVEQYVCSGGRMFTVENGKMQERTDNPTPEQIMLENDIECLTGILNKMKTEYSKYSSVTKKTNHVFLKGLLAAGFGVGLLILVALGLSAIDSLNYIEAVPFFSPWFAIGAFAVYVSGARGDNRQYDYKCGLEETIADLDERIASKKEELEATKENKPVISVESNSTLMSFESYNSDFYNNSLRRLERIKFLGSIRKELLQSKEEAEVRSLLMSKGMSEEDVSDIENFVVGRYALMPIQEKNKK